MELMQKLIGESKAALNVLNTEGDSYLGYFVRPGDYHVFRDKSIVNRYQDVGKKTNFYHKLHLPVNIKNEDDYEKLWRLVTSFVKDYPEIASTKIISLDNSPERNQPGKEAVVYFAPDFWEGYKSNYQMYQRQKEIMEDINNRLLNAGLSFSEAPSGDIPLNPEDKSSLVYISALEYTINTDGSYGKYVYAKERDFGFSNPYDEENLKKLLIAEQNLSIEVTNEIEDKNITKYFPNAMDNVSEKIITLIDEEIIRLQKDEEDSFFTFNSKNKIAALEELKSRFINPSQGKSSSNIIEEWENEEKYKNGWGTIVKRSTMLSTHRNFFSDFFSPISHEKTKTHLFIEMLKKTYGDMNVELFNIDRKIKI